jgi:hypothetical protein
MKTGRQPRTGAASAAAATLVLLVALLAAAPARATIIFGSDLTQAVAPSPSPGPCESGPAPCTGILVASRRSNPIPTASPASGQVVAFDVKTAAAVTVEFQIFDLLPEIPGQISASASITASVPVLSLPGPGTYRIPVALHIGAGQYIGLQTSAPAAVGACAEGAETYWFTGPLTAGAPTPGHVGVPCELLLSAEVVPGASVTFQRGTLRPRSGRVRLGVNVPGPGDLTLAGRGIATTTRHVGAAGFIDQLVSITRALRGRLLRAGSVELPVTATFAPEGGTPRSRSRLVRFDVVGPGISLDAAGRSSDAARTSAPTTGLPPDRP